MATTNPHPNKTGVDNNSSQMMLQDIALGTTVLPSGSNYDTIQNALGDRIMKVDQDLGIDKDPENLHAASVDHVRQDASGINLDGTLDFGDGAQVTSTTWPSDHEVTEGGEFTYFRPLAATQGDYNEQPS